MLFSGERSAQIKLTMKKKRPWPPLKLKGPCKRQKGLLMANVYNVDEKMRKMRAKLYPSYLPGTEGNYVARTANEATADIGNICASVNRVFVPGNQFVITGDKIKVAGEDPACGVYMVPVDDPSSALKLTRIAENSPGRR
jgi:hypothetical protein